MKSQANELSSKYEDYIKKLKSQLKQKDQELKETKIKLAESDNKNLYIIRNLAQEVAQVSQSVK